MQAGMRVGPLPCACPLCSHLTSVPWPVGGQWGELGGKWPPRRCWLHADAGQRRKEPWLCRQHLGPDTPRLPRYLSPAEGRARGRRGECK